MLSDQIVRWIRTWVPYAVGYGLTWVARAFGIVIDEATMAMVGALAATILGAGYWFIVAELEEHVWSGFGWLLGVPKSKTNKATLRTE